MLQPVKGDHSKDFCPDESTLGKSLLAGVSMESRYCRSPDAKTVKTPPIRMGWLSRRPKRRRDGTFFLRWLLWIPQQVQNSKRSGISFFKGTRRWSVLRRRKSSLILIESRISAPCRQDWFFHQGGLERVRKNAVLLCFTYLGVFSCWTFP